LIFLFSNILEVAVAEKSVARGGVCKVAYDNLTILLTIVVGILSIIKVMGLVFTKLLTNRFSPYSQHFIFFVSYE
jgi:hypothetical protein